MQLRRMAEIKTLDLTGISVLLRSFYCSNDGTNLQYYIEIPVKSVQCKLSPYSEDPVKSHR